MGCHRVGLHGDEPADMAVCKMASGGDGVDK